MNDHRIAFEIRLIESCSTFWGLQLVALLQRNNAELHIHLTSLESIAGYENERIHRVLVHEKSTEADSYEPLKRVLPRNLLFAIDRTPLAGLSVISVLKMIHGYSKTADLNCPVRLLFHRHDYEGAYKKIVPYATSEEIVALQKQKLRKSLEDQKHSSIEKTSTTLDIDLSAEKHLIEMLGEKLYEIPRRLMSEGWQAYQYNGATWYFNPTEKNIYAEHPVRAEAAVYVAAMSLRAKHAVRVLERGMKRAIEYKRRVQEMLDETLEYLTDETAEFTIRLSIIKYIDKCIVTPMVDQSVSIVMDRMIEETMAHTIAKYMCDEAVRNSTDFLLELTLDQAILKYIERKAKEDAQNETGDVAILTKEQKAWIHRRPKVFSLDHVDADMKAAAKSAAIQQIRLKEAAPKPKKQVFSLDTVDDATSAAAKSAAIQQMREKVSNPVKKSPVKAKVELKEESSIPESHYAASCSTIPTKNASYWKGSEKSPIAAKKPCAKKKSNKVSCSRRSIDRIVHRAACRIQSLARRYLVRRKMQTNFYLARPAAWEDVARVQQRLRESQNELSTINKELQLAKQTIQKLHHEAGLRRQSLEGTEMLKKDAEIMKLQNEIDSLRIRQRMSLSPSKMQLIALNPDCNIKSLNQVVYDVPAFPEPTLGVKLSKIASTPTLEQSSINWLDRMEDPLARGGGETLVRYGSLDRLPKRK